MQRSQQKSEALQNNDLTVADISGRYKRAIDRRSRWLSLWRFSCWNVNDPNRVKIVIVSIRSRTFQACLRVARRAMAGTLIDTTSGATHYHHKAINPPWARGGGGACRHSRDRPPPVLQQHRIIRNNEE